MANVGSGITMISAGGCAGAGPSSGLSGWNRTSGAVTNAIPLTVNRRGAAPVTGTIEIVSPILACSVAASCWSSTTLPGRESALQEPHCARCAR